MQKRPLGKRNLSILTRCHGSAVDLVASGHTKLTLVHSARVRSAGSWPEFVGRDRLVYELDHFCGFSRRETGARGLQLHDMHSPSSPFFRLPFVFKGPSRPQRCMQNNVLICLSKWKIRWFQWDFFFKGPSHPDPVNISMFRVFEVLSVNWSKIEL